MRDPSAHPETRPEDHARLAALFDEAMSSSDGDRAAMLDRLDRDDPAMAQPLRVLLELAATPDPFERIAGSHAAVPSPWHPATIGPFRVVRAIESSSHSAVYEAERIAAPHDRVAVKLVPTGAVSDEARWRFASECAAIASVAHPNVAQIREVGAADDGRPWVAVEFVDGLDLRSHCRATALDVRATVALVATVCDAVQAMHQRGVLHRDLKPSNILVTRMEVGGEVQDVPKLIDFGLARRIGEGWSRLPRRLAAENHVEPPTSRASAGAATAADRFERSTPHTATGQLLGTLPYMSPEALGGNPHEIDVRTDIYALGVITFELLAGRRPFDLAELPVPGRLGAGAAPPDLGAVNASCRGDLARVVAKAMSFQRDGRYGSASDLGADLRRWLRHEPVAARPTSLLHNATLFVRRQRVLTAAAIVAAALLATVMVMVVRDAQRSREALGQTRSMLAFVIGELLPSVEELPGGIAAQDKIRRFVNDATEPGLQHANDPFMQWMRARTLVDQTYGDGARDSSMAETWLAEAMTILDGLDAIDGSSIDEGVEGDDGNGLDQRASGAALASSTGIPGRVQRELLRATIVVRQGNLAKARGDMQRTLERQSVARRMLESILQTHRDEPSAWSQLAFVHEEDGTLSLMDRAWDSADGHFDRMAEALDRVEALAPEHRSLAHARVALAFNRAGVALGRSRLDRDDPATVRREYERAIVLARQRIATIATDRSAREQLIRASTVLAERHSAEGRHQQAIELLDAAMPHAVWLSEIDAGGPRAAEMVGEVHDYLGRAKLAADDPEGALRSFDRAKEFFAIARNESPFVAGSVSRLAAIDALRARALARLGRDDDARDAYRSACDLHREVAATRPTFDAFVSLAISLAEAPAGVAIDVPEMIGAANRAMELAPDHPRAWEAMALAELRASRLAEAKQAAERAIALCGEGSPELRTRMEQLLGTIANESIASSTGGG